MAQRQVHIKVRPQRRGGPDDNDPELAFAVGGETSRQMSRQAIATVSAIDQCLADNHAS